MGGWPAHCHESCKRTNAIENFNFGNPRSRLPPRRINFADMFIPSFECPLDHTVAMTTRGVNNRSNEESIRRARWAARMRAHEFRTPK